MKVMHAWLIWLILAAALAGAETLCLDLVLMMCAGGAGPAGSPRLPDCHRPSR